MIPDSQPNSVRMADAPGIDEQIVARMVFECLTPPINKAYRDSFVLGCGSLARFMLRARRVGSTAALPEAPVLCFSAFRNEKAAVAGALRLHPDWRACNFEVDEGRLAGLDWRAVLAPAPKMFVPFIRAVRHIGGARAVRNFAMPFVGYLLYQHLLGVFCALRSRPAILTTNLVAPLSLSVHLAAKACGLRTIFWEHAMTPRLVIHVARGYDHYHLNCEHTRQAFIEDGTSADRLSLIGNQASPRALPLSEAMRRIGVCVNDLDGLSDTRELLQALVASGFETTLRVHDSDIRFRELSRMAGECRVSFSNAAKSTIAAFMGDVDLVIAGNSNVLLDCLKAGKPVVYFWPGDSKLFDYYGIVAAAGCLHFTGAAQIASHLDRLDKRHEASI